MFARAPGHENDPVLVATNQAVVADAETENPGVEILELVSVVAVDAEMAEHERRRTERGCLVLS